VCARHPREGEFLFSRDASTSTPIVAMAVRLLRGVSGAQSAFSTGGLCLSDNFEGDADFVPVENLTFGPAKLFLERYNARAFIADGAQWPTARVLASLPKFTKMVDRMTLEEALEARPEYRALHDAPDSALARLQFLDALARRHLEAVHKAVLKFGRCKGIGLEDLVFAAAAAAEDGLRALAAASGAAGTLDDNFARAWRCSSTCRAPTRASPSRPSAASRGSRSSRRPGTA
jgi:hypothetical protein